MVWGGADERVVADPLDVVGVAPGLQARLADVHLAAAAEVLRGLDRTRPYVAFLPNLGFRDTNPPLVQAALLLTTSHSYPSCQTLYLGDNLRARFDLVLKCKGHRKIEIHSGRVDRYRLVQESLLLLSDNATLLVADLDIKGLHLLGDRPDLRASFHDHLSEAELGFRHLSLPLVSAFTPVKDHVEEFVVDKHVEEVGDGASLLPDEDILLSPLDLASADLLPPRPLAPARGSALGTSASRSSQALRTPSPTIAPPELQDLLLSGGWTKVNWVDNLVDQGALLYLETWVNLIL